MGLCDAHKGGRNEAATSSAYGIQIVVFISLCEAHIVRMVSTDLGRRATSGDSSREAQDNVFRTEVGQVWCAGPYQYRSDLW